MKYIFYEAKKDRTNQIFVARPESDGPCRLHFHRAFEIAYIRSGQASYNIEDAHYDASADDIVFSHCYYRHQTLQTVESARYVIAIPEALARDISALFQNDTLPTQMQDKAFNKTLLPFFEKLVYESAAMSPMLIKSYANLIFGELAAHYGTVPVTIRHKSVSLIASILDYIDENSASPLTLESIAEHFFYNKTYFSRLFNHHIDMSLNNYINAVRYDKFKTLHEAQPDKSITELAMLCGFTSMATFYRLHKIRTPK